jgi:hypothetical protein
MRCRRSNFLIQRSAISLIGTGLMKCSFSRPCRFQETRFDQMLGDCPVRHVQPLAQIAERLTILPVQPVQQLPAACVCQRAKDGILSHDHKM